VKSSDDPKKRHLSKFEADQTWEAVYKHISDDNSTNPTTLMACGPKATGKSSFCQYLINRLVTETTIEQGVVTRAGRPRGAFLLDLDPGQPFFCAVGQVSLTYFEKPFFGPQFTNPEVEGRPGIETMKVHHVGLVSLRGDPDHYVHCALELLKVYWSLVPLLPTFPSRPLIVNTPAWIAGAGLEVLTQLVKSLGITKLVYMGASQELQEPLEEVAKTHGAEFVTVSPAPSDLTTRVAKELQVMHMMSYFHISGRLQSNLTWSAAPLFTTRPWVVSYASSDRSIFAIVVPGDNSGYDYLYNSLEGSVVGMVAMTSGSPFDEISYPRFKESDEDTIMGDGGQNPTSSSGANVPTFNVLRCSRTKLPFIRTGHGTHTPLHPRRSYSLGLALIRAIDQTAQTIHLVTPITSGAIANVIRFDWKIFLVQTNFEAPEWVFEEELHYYQSKERKDLRIPEKEGTDPGELDVEMTRCYGNPWVTTNWEEEAKMPDNRVRKVDRSGYVIDSEAEGSGERAGLGVSST
jgi:polynucleotide 5'-hydroxyl-kinase GRC3/NOL9